MKRGRLFLAPLRISSSFAASCGDIRELFVREIPWVGCVIDIQEFGWLSIESIGNLFSRILVASERAHHSRLCDLPQRFSCLDANFAFLVLHFKLCKNALQCVRPRLVMRCEFVSFRCARS